MVYNENIEETPSSLFESKHNSRILIEQAEYVYILIHLNR